MKKLILGIIVLFGSTAFAEVKCYLAEAGGASHEMSKNSDGNFEKSISGYDLNAEISSIENGKTKVYYQMVHIEKGLDVTGSGILGEAGELNGSVDFDMYLDKTGTKNDVIIQLSCTKI